MEKPEPGAGDVEIELDGKPFTLVPTLNACLTISRIAGGGMAAIQRCQQLDFDTVCAVIIAGMGLNPVQAKKVPEAVYKTGIIALHGKCIDFIHIVNNGGRPPADPDEEEAEEDQDEAAGPTESPSP